MKCIVKLTYDDKMWISSATMEDGKPLGATLESGSCDALMERVKTVVLEMLELNHGYVGEVDLSFEVDRKEKLEPISWKPREV